MNEQKIKLLVEQLKKREVKVYKLIDRKCTLTNTVEMEFDAALDLKFSGAYHKVEISGPPAWVYMRQGFLGIKPIAVLDISDPYGCSSHLTNHKVLRAYNQIVLLVAAEQIEVEGITLPEGQKFWYPHAISRKAFRTREEALKPRGLGAPFALSAYTANGEFVEKPVILNFPLSQPYSTPA
jgi:hypothetical protein